MRETIYTLPLGLYQHFKGGHYFVDSVEHCTTNGFLDGRQYIRYYSLTHQHWVTRDRAEFLEVVPWPDGQHRPRFMPVTPSSILAALVPWAQGKYGPEFTVEEPRLGQ